MLREINRSGVVTTFSETVECFLDGAPPLGEFQKHLACAKDILALTAGDPHFRSPLDERAPWLVSWRTT
ncbi:MAG: hypothetical protein WBB42_10335 [Polyangiales bacterium]